MRMFSLVFLMVRVSYTETYNMSNTQTNYLLVHSRRMGISETLRRLMEANNENPHSLSVKTKVTQPTIFRILSGESKEPRRSNVEKLARFFGLTVEELYGKELPKLSVEQDVKVYEIRDVDIDELVEIMRSLDASRRNEVLVFARERQLLQNSSLQNSTRRVG